MLGQLRSQGLYPPVSTGAPVFYVDGSYQHGGAIEPTEPLTITAPTGGTLYYTLDGSDPRLPGGGVSNNALQFTGSPVYLSESVLVKSRVLNGTTWSALSEARFYVGAPATAENLVV